MINLFCSKLLIKLISISIQIYSKFKYKLGNLVICILGNFESENISHENITNYNN